MTQKPTTKYLSPHSKHFFRRSSDVTTLMLFAAITLHLRHLAAKLARYTDHWMGRPCVCVCVCVCTLWGTPRTQHSQPVTARLGKDPKSQTFA
jgi:hypothetical protein